MNRTLAMALVAAAGLGAGCAGTEQGGTLTAALEKAVTAIQPAASISEPKTAPTAAATKSAHGTAQTELPAQSRTVVALGLSPTAAGSPIAVYERVARGALRCWFGGRGPLHKTHIFNADVAPPSQGSGAELMIHERELNPLPNQLPRGARVFRVWFERESETTTRVRMEAAKLPQDLVHAMEHDTVAWAGDKESCMAQVVRPPPVVEEPVKSKLKPKARKASPARTTPAASAVSLRPQLR